MNYEFMLLLDIDQITLKEIHPLLCLSAGYEVSIDDELEYFDLEIGASWILAQDGGGQKLGFIRSFPQGPNWSLGELYVDQNCENRRQIASELLKSFDKRIKFGNGHRLRFDIRIQDIELNDEVVACGYSHKKQVFLHFETQVLKSSAVKSLYSKPILSQASQIVEILNFLNEVSDVEVLNWIKEDAIRVVVNDSNIASAAQISVSDGAVEIIRIATHAKYLRKGFAKKLISQIFQEAARMEKSCVYLKVEEIRIPAIATYRNLGFIENETKSQIWHSRWY